MFVVFEHFQCQTMQKTGLTLLCSMDPILYSFVVFVAFQAPAVHVVAVGLESGRIILHNLKFDETVLELKQDWGPVTTLSFRTGKTFIHQFRIK